MAYTHDQLDTKAERNQINEAMRASQEWRTAIQQMGLNPDGPLKLTKTQQQQLGRQLGLPLSDFHIDPAGNINDFHGWKGLPTWAKVAIISGAAVGTAGAAGAFSGGGSAAASGFGGSAATGGGLIPGTTIAGGMASVPIAPAVLGGTAAATTAGTAAAGKSIWDRLKGLVPVAGAVGRGLQAAGEGMADNRVGEYLAEIEREKLRQAAERDYQSQFINREQEGREGRTSAWKQLQQAAYAQNWGKQDRTPFSPYTRALTPPPQTVVEGAAGLEAEVKKRLLEGNPVPVVNRPPPMPTLPKAGIWERLLPLAGIGLDIYGNPLQRRA